MKSQKSPSQAQLSDQRLQHATIIAASGGIDAAIACGALPKFLDTTLSEAIILGLLRQNVKRFLSVLGHGSTEIGEVLRIYEQVGLLKTYALHSEIEASHAATALRWTTGEKAAVITSIGPGALQALAASIAPASDGLGVWYLLGDETTEDEGPNMQQIPKAEQHNFLTMCATLGRAYNLETPLSLATALRRGMNTVDHPHRPGPFYLLLPLNTQPVFLPAFNLDELPSGLPPALGAASGIQPMAEANTPADGYALAIDLIAHAKKIVVKVGGGSRNAGKELVAFLEQSGAVSVTSPLVSGVIPYAHPQNMGVGGSKGSLCGNYAMENADLLIAVGARPVCQADCSRTGYLQAEHVININTDLETAMHYGKTLGLVGDAALTLAKLNCLMQEKGMTKEPRLAWLSACAQKKQAWETFKQQRYSHPTLFDETWGEEVLTQPAALKIALDWAKKNDAICYFDAGDVQANGFQIVEDDVVNKTFSETGASYMGFAGSSLLATALTQKPYYALAFSGDGSFWMAPQILIDGVEHGAQGCLLVFDNRRMGAITGLQLAQYGEEYATHTQKPVDYVALAGSIQGLLALEGGKSVTSLQAALEKAHSHQGLSFIHIPVYFGTDELGGMGVFGRWNVGNNVQATQALRHQIGL